MALELAFDQGSCETTTGVAALVRTEQDDIFMWARSSGYLTVTIGAGILGVDEALDQFWDIVVTHKVDICE